MQISNLDALERRAYQATVDHGFFDLLLAAAVAVFALTVAVSPWCILAMFPLVIAKRPLLKAFNRHVVEPRVGHVQLSPVRLEQISTARKTAALALIGLSLFINRVGDLVAPLGDSGPLVWLGNHAEVQIALVAGLAIALLAWLFRLPRFFAYSLVVPAVPAATAAAGLPPSTGWVISTLIVLAAATSVLVRFVHRNPVAS